MQIDVILQAESLDKIKDFAEKHLNVPLRMIREELSIFEQYIIRPLERKFIPEIWSYRIICKQGKYYFGKSSVFLRADKP
jgi:hypothetical protein